MGIDPVTHSPRLDLLDLSNLLNPSLYPSSTTNINFSRLLGVQPFINPDLIRLASSLLSSDRRPLPQNHLFPSCNNQVSPSPTPLPHQNQNELMQYEAAPGFGEWQAEDYGELGNYGYYGSDQSAVDLDGAPAPSSETFQSNTSSSNNNNNFSFQSVLSTPSSSPPSLHSASNCNITTQDQTYCTQMLKFQIPADILDVADFISFPS